MASSSELPNYSESPRADEYTIPEQAQSTEKPQMQPGNIQSAYSPQMQPGQVQYVQSPYMQPGQIQYVQSPYMQPGQVFMNQNPMDPSIAKIRDWLPWSIINIFIGWFFLGIVALIFSLLCRRRKAAFDASGARTMSTLALVTNILVTLAGLAGWIGLIIVVAVSSSNRTTYSSSCYPYC